jgi:hypothetical protein
MEDVGCSACCRVEAISPVASPFEQPLQDYLPCLPHEPGRPSHVAFATPAPQEGPGAHTTPSASANLYLHSSCCPSWIPQPPRVNLQSCPFAPPNHNPSRQPERTSLHVSPRKIWKISKPELPSTNLLQHKKSLKRIKQSIP